MRREMLPFLILRIFSHEHNFVAFLCNRLKGYTWWSLANISYIIKALGWAVRNRVHKTAMHAMSHAEAPDAAAVDAKEATCTTNTQA